MTRRRVILFFAALLVVAGVIAYLCFPKQPRYQGRKLTEWTSDMYSVWTNFHANEAAFVRQKKFFAEDPKWLAAGDALRHIGTNAVPWLLKLAGDTDSQQKRNLIHWLNAHPQLHIHLRTSEEKRTEALWAFLELRDKNKPAAPKLIEWTYDKNPERRLAGLRFLGFTMPGKETLLPVLRRLLKDKDWDVKSLAAEIMLLRCPEEAAAAGIDKLYPAQKEIVDMANERRKKSAATVTNTGPLK